MSKASKMMQVKVPTIFCFNGIGMDSVSKQEQKSEIMSQARYQNLHPEVMQRVDRWFREWHSVIYTVECSADDDESKIESDPNHYFRQCIKLWKTWTLDAHELPEAGDIRSFYWVEPEEGYEGELDIPMVKSGVLKNEEKFISQLSTYLGIRGGKTGKAMSIRIPTNGEEGILARNAMGFALAAMSVNPVFKVLGGRYFYKGANIDVEVYYEGEEAKAVELANRLYGRPERFEPMVIKPKLRTEAKPQPVEFRRGFYRGEAKGQRGGFRGGKSRY